MTMNIDTTLKLICDAIIESIETAGPLGAPAGPLYAAMMHYGFTLEEFTSLMNGLVRAGKIRQKGNLYFSVE